MKVKSILFLLFWILIGCSTFHSQLFLLDERGETISGLYIFPTIVAYENARDQKREHYGENDFWVEIRVTDTLTRFPGKLLEVAQDDPQLIEARGKFRERVMTALTVDSLIINYILPVMTLDTLKSENPVDTSINLDTTITYREIREVLPAIIDVPGWKWQLIYRFGNINIPSSAGRLTVVVPYTQFDSTFNQFRPNSLTFSMRRYESHEKALWAEDIPNNFR